MLKKILSIVFLIPLLSCGGGGGGGGSHSTRSPQWLVLIYMDGDNSLNSVIDDDLDEIRSVNFPSSIKVVVLVDSIGDNGGEIYETVDGHLQKTANIDEPNMGSKETVVWFANKFVTKYSPQKVALIFWDHGYGWRSAGPTTREAAVENNPQDLLLMFEVREALKELKNSGISVNLIGFDECLMGTAEVLYDIKDFAEVIVASENEEDLNGWNYSSIFNRLIQNPEASAVEFAHMIVDAFSDTSCSISYGCTLVAITQSEIEELIKGVNEIAQTYNSSVNSYFASARVNSKENPNFTEFLDLYSFAEELNNTLSNCTGCQRVMDVIDGLYKNLVDTEFKGIGIYFPEDNSTNSGYSDCYFLTEGSNATCSFSSLDNSFSISVNGYYNPFTETLWDDFLKQYYQNQGGLL